MGRLDEVDLGHPSTREDADRRLVVAQERLLRLRLRLGGQLGGRGPGPPLLVLFEGWDAAGKGGAIKRLTAPLDPRHVTVRQFGVPTENERRHPFLWRFWPAVPGWGGMAVFDRSWYGRVLVERVDELAAPEQWQRAYAEIVDFERLLVQEGMILVKLFLHISSAEQLRRFRRREQDPLRRWKLTDEDWKNRARRADYGAAIEEMLLHTDLPLAPWHVIGAESKHDARAVVLERVCEAIDSALLRAGGESAAG
ncbi:MAG: hypothetical protein NVSMB51_15830 [Solirubrobacteraceae bacterium]